jgi:hypothetical protein
VANVKGLDSGRQEQIKKQICLKYSVIVVIGGSELISSILSEKPTSHSTYPTLPCSVPFAMTTWQRQEEDLFFKCARACYGTKYFDFESNFNCIKKMHS